MARATLLDETEQSLQEGEVVDNVEEDGYEDNITAEQQVEEPSVDVDSVVEENKSLKQKLGNQGNEIGSMRKQLDELLQLSLQSKAEPKEAEEEVDIWSDPDKFVEAKLRNHPKLKQLDQLTKAQVQSTSEARLREAHPDFKDIIQDEGFHQWVGQRPARLSMLKKAHEQYDFESADELFTNWKELRAVVTSATNEGKAERRKTTKAASTGTASSASSAPGRRKIYRRADLIKLRKENPSRYESLGEEIMQAYADGRVR
jgi:hypothetical protein|tara:strand:- start:547 stop:1323 length:777 start_codon:yes stop_codon:yes gene_type:complete